MIIKGVDLSSLPSQFEGCVQGRTLILDGDGPAYRVAATVKRLDTAIRRFQQDVLTQLFVTKSQSVRIHLTASTSKKAGRFNIKAVKPYQGQRKKGDKPPLLEPLRQAMTLPENWLPEFEFVRMHYDLEADDGMMHDAYALKENGVIWSDDKDLRMTPYPYYEISKATVQPGCSIGYVEVKHTPSGTPKLTGQGPMFFWGQMLAGDTADHVQGIRVYRGQLCGPVGAYNALRIIGEMSGNISEAANIVLDGYRAIDQNPLPEGWMLWLLRWPGDSFWQYLQELDLSQQNKEFVYACASRDWFNREATHESECTQ